MQKNIKFKYIFFYHLLLHFGFNFSHQFFLLHFLLKFSIFKQLVNVALLMLPKDIIKAQIS